MSPKRNQMAALVVIQNNEGSHARTHACTRTHTLGSPDFAKEQWPYKKHGLS